MVSSATNLARALLEDSPQKRLEKKIRDERNKIQTALKETGEYQLTDDEGRVFVIRKK